MNRPRRVSTPARYWRTRFILWGVCLAAGIVLGVVQLVRMNGAPAPVADESQPPPAAPPLPALANNPYRETMRGASYVGSQVCGDCHDDQHASYLHTAHSRSFAPIDLASEPPDGEFAHAANAAWRYRSYREGGKLRHREFLATAEGERTLVDRPLAWLVGSGRFSRTYLAEVDGFLVESPVTWYASLEAWNLSPGFERGVHASFARNISADCLYCHVGQAETQGDSEFRVKIHQQAIGCERCHGPGSVHVAQRKAVGQVDGEKDLTIVHPRKLPREVSEAICHQCHLETVASAVVRGRRRDQFRPGDRWTDFVVNYAYESGAEEMTVTGHVQQMHASRCYQASDTLTCISCHDPHASPAPAERRDYYRKACLQCHQEAACTLPAPERAAKNQNDCAACHMPQSPTDIPHIAFTHHRIGIHRPNSVPLLGGQAVPPDSVPLPGGQAVPPDNVPLLGGQAVPPQALAPVLDVAHLPELDRQRALGLAYMRLMSEHADDQRFLALGPRAEKLLQDAAAGGLRDPAVETALALLAGSRGDHDAARAKATAALSDPSLAPGDRAEALYLLAGLDLRENHLPEARERLEELVRLRLKPSDWFLLGVCRQRQGDEAGAIAAYEKVLEIDPSEPGTYRTLIPLYEARGEAAKAEQAGQTLTLLEAQLGKTAN